jgi:hypothetical protein
MKDSVLRVEWMVVTSIPCLWEYENNKEMIDDDGVKKRLVIYKEQKKEHEKKY